MFLSFFLPGGKTFLYVFVELFVFGEELESFLGFENELGMVWAIFVGHFF